MMEYAEQIGKKLVGLTMEDAVKLCRKENIVLRTTGKGTAVYPKTEGYNSNRVNVHLSEDDIIKSYYVG